MTMILSASDPPTVVFLRHGVSVSRAAIGVLWDLEERGLTVRCDGQGLLVGPRSQLTPSDRSAIRKHKGELMSLVRICANEVVA